MKPNVFKGTACGNRYYMKSVPLSGLNIDAFSRAFYNLGDDMKLDDFTRTNMKSFCEIGFTEQRVSNARIIGEPDQMILYAMDEEFNTPVGLAVVFNQRFYAQGYSEGCRSEKELYLIFKAGLHEN